MFWLQVVFLKCQAIFYLFSLYYLLCTSCNPWRKILCLNPPCWFMKIYPSFASKAGGQRCMRSMLPMEMAVFVWAVLVYFTVKWREIGLPTLWQPSLINLIDWHFGETFYFHWLETDFRWLQQMFSPKGVAPPESVLPCGCLSLELHNVTETHKQVEKEMVGISLINLNDSWFSVRSWPTPDFISQEL